MKIFIVIPAYNESQAIGPVVRKLRESYENVVVVDDGSQDSTGVYARNNGASVLRHIINKGQGAALRTGTAYALSQGADIIVHFDADGQFEVSDIEHMIEPIRSGEHDVTLGSRFLGTSNATAIRKFILKGGIWFTYLVSGIKLTDAHNGFRVLSRDAAAKITITQDGMAHNSQIIDQIAVHGLRYVERGVTVRYTEYSKSKGQSSWNALKIARDVLINKLVR